MRFPSYRGESNVRHGCRRPSLEANGLGRLSCLCCCKNADTASFCPLESHADDRLNGVLQKLGAAHSGSYCTVALHVRGFVLRDETWRTVRQ